MTTIRKPSPIDPNWRDQPIIISPEFYRNFGWAVFVLIGVALGFILFAPDDGFLANVYTESFSILVTVFIIDRLAKHREIQSLRERLPRQARSSANSIAIGAVEELRAHGWLKDENSLLKDECFFLANLENVNLSWANLKSTDFNSANLAGARLSWANLQLASLAFANLKKASLYSANLQLTSFVWANLTDADLEGANLSCADLENACLCGANLTDVAFDTYTTLPDGSQWAPDTDMTRFTDPNHPEFWRPPERE